MKKEDFIIPSFLEKNRSVILKGKVYEYNGTLIMAQETTCSLTKPTFKGVCVGRDEEQRSDRMTIIGSKGKWIITNFS